MYHSRLILRQKKDARDIEKAPALPVQPFSFSIRDSLIPGFHPWDQAHLACRQDPMLAFAEPDLDASLHYWPQPPAISKNMITDNVDPGEIVPGPYLECWPAPEHPCIWHTGAAHSQLKDAREEISRLPCKAIIRIAHLDTGYDPHHLSFPRTLIRHDLERNFAEGEADKYHTAADTCRQGQWQMPGHGAATLALLAGARLSLPQYDFNDHLGLHESIEIVPIRLAGSVILLRSTAFVRAMEYILHELHEDPGTRIDIITMSMGGIASQAWAGLVNEAYEKGIFIVSAAGNNFRKLPARTLVYPARFNRVVAACGVTYDLSPYCKPSSGSSWSVMEGNHGPKALMQTAIAAFTPNTPWADIRHPQAVQLDGNGTSSATPQVAAAAACYMIKYHRQLSLLPEPWMKVEATRHALFSAARKYINGYQGDHYSYFGNGILQAKDMLGVAVPNPAILARQPEDEVSFPLFRLLAGTRQLPPAAGNKAEMLETELIQLLLTTPALQKLVRDEELSPEKMSRDEWLQFIALVSASPQASVTLQQELDILRPSLAGKNT